MVDLLVRLSDLARRKAGLLEQEAQLWETLSQILKMPPRPLATFPESAERKTLPLPVHDNALPSHGYVRLDVILQVFPVSKSTWWKGVKEGRFPASIKLGPKTTAWRVEDIRRLIGLTIR